jgi:hypothetical protein
MLPPDAARRQRDAYVRPKYAELWQLAQVRGDD